MIVTKHVPIRPVRFVPLCDGFIDRNCNPTNTAAVTNGMTMMKPEHLVVNREIGVIPITDNERHPWISEASLQRVVHHVFKRVALLGTDVRLCRNPAVVTASTHDSQFEC